MFKKIIISAFAAVSLMIAAGAPASAAMNIANPSAETAAAKTEIVQVRGGRKGGFRRGGGRRFGGRGGRFKGWGKHRRWGHRWHRRHNWRHYRHAYYGDCFWRYGRKYCSYH